MIYNRLPQFDTDLPDHIKRRYPTIHSLIEAIKLGIVVRDQYGNFVIKGDPPLTDTVHFPQNYGYIGSNNVK